MELLKEFNRDPRYTVIAALVVFLVYSFASGSSLNFVLPIALTIAAGAIIELGLFYFEKKPLVLPLSAIVTSAIISIVLTPSLSTIHFSLLAVLIALLSKHFVKIGFSHIFNPANFGSLAVSLLNSSLQSWWATSNPLLVLILSAVVVNRVNSWLIVVPFLLATFLLQAAFQLYSGAVNVSFLTATVYSGTVLFFAMILLVEPMTTPGQPRAKVAFGVIAALLAFVFSFVLPEVGFLAALAVSNLSVQFLDSKLAA